MLFISVAYLIALAGMAWLFAHKPEIALILILLAGASCGISGIPAP
jgi:hypothetical protein